MVKSARNLVEKASLVLSTSICFYIKFQGVWFWILTLSGWFCTEAKRVGNPHSSVHVIKIITAAVQKLLEGTSTFIATSPNGIPALILKQSVADIILYVTWIYQHSRDNGILPED